MNGKRRRRRRKRHRLHCNFKFKVIDRLRLFYFCLFFFFFGVSRNGPLCWFAAVGSTEGEGNRFDAPLSRCNKNQQRERDMRFIRRQMSCCIIECYLANNGLERIDEFCIFTSPFTFSICYTQVAGLRNAKCFTANEPPRPLYVII